MKKTLAFLAIFFALTGCIQSAKGPNGVVYHTVIQYNDYIVDRQMYIIKTLKDMVAMISANKNLALNMLSNASKKCLETAKEVEGMPAWKGNTNFRDKAVGMFRYYGTTYATEFKELIEQSSNPEITETDRASLIDKGKAIDKEEERMNQGFINAQKEFSEANNLRLENKDAK